MASRPPSALLPSLLPALVIGAAGLAALYGGLHMSFALLTPQPPAGVLPSSLRSSAALLLTGGVALLAAGVAVALRSMLRAPRQSGPQAGPPLSQGPAADTLPPRSPDLEPVFEPPTRPQGDEGELWKLLMQLQTALIRLGPNDQVRFVNHAARTLLGLSDELKATTLLELVRSPTLHGLVERARSGGVHSAEVELPRAGGRIVVASAQPEANPGDVLLTLRDISELRRLETVRRDFVANVSHELRTPLSVIRANAETLVDGALDDEDHGVRFVEAIQRNADRLTHLVADLMDISRIESGSYPLEIEPVPLDELARTSVQAVRDAATAQRQSLLLDVPEGLVIRGDAHALDQILLNLLDNAVKYGREGGHIELKASLQGERALVEVLDDGPGVEPHQRKRLFERFYRVDRGRSRAMGGTGLGLSITKNLVEAMGGAVGVRPNVPRGSVFWLTLPVVEDGDSAAPGKEV